MMAMGLERLRTRCKIGIVGNQWAVYCEIETGHVSGSHASLIAPSQNGPQMRQETADGPPHQRFRKNS